MISGFERLGRLIERTASMTRIATGSWIEKVVRYSISRLRFWVRQIANGIPNREPG
jgi:hypothetical protein